MDSRFPAPTAADVAGFRPPEPHRRRALELVMKLLALPGVSGEETPVVEFIHGQLLAAGASPRWLATDSAHRRTPLGGDVGNLILRLPGTRRAPRRMLLAHLDTVSICAGCKPVRRGRLVRSAAPGTGLGADDRAGAAAILGAAVEILRRRLPHPPLTFLWTVQEERGLHGARYVSLRRLGKVALAFNFDGGSAAKLTVGATGGYRTTIEVHGLAAHAGGAPEMGVSAIAIAARAIADLDQRGWHGDVLQGNVRGTSNFGTIEGGRATNVVADRVTIRAEARSHDPHSRRKIQQEIEQAFRQAAKQVKNAGGECGRVQFDGRLDYESFRLRDEEPCVRLAEAAIRSLDLKPQRAITNGGLDANWMVAHGIPTVTLGCGALRQHTVSEALDLLEYERACRIALRLATGWADPRQ